MGMAGTGDVMIEGFRLSAQQATHWRLRQRQRVAGTISVTGPLDEVLLRSAVEHMVAGHEILRTRFRRLPAMAMPLQVIAGDAAFGWTRHDLRDRQAEVPALLGRIRSSDVDLEAGPVLHADLITIGPDEHLLHLTLPALAADSLTLPNLAGLVARTYDALRAGLAVPDIEVQYVQFSEWQHEQRTGDDAAEGQEYWQRAGTGGGELAMSWSFGPAGVGTPARSVLSQMDTAELDALVQRLGIDHHTVLLACWGALLARLDGVSSVQVGTMLDGRKFDELRDALGPFTTEVPVDVPAELRRSFVNVARHVQRTMDARRDWQEHWPGDATVTDGLRACFEYLEYPAEYRAGDVTLRVTELHADCDPRTVGLSCRRNGDSTALDFVFDPDVFDANDMDRLSASYVAFVGSVLRAPDSLIGDLSLLSDAHAHEVLTTFNPSVTAVEEQPETFQLQFERQVQRTPGAIAVSSDDLVLTYADLNHRANRVAERLVSLGVGPEVPVAVHLDRSPAAVVAVVAVCKAGGVYIPLDATDPLERLAFVLSDAQARVLVTDSRLSRRLPEGDWQVVDLDAAELGASDLGAGDWPPVTDPPRRTTPGNGAYVIYTSGSTGRPKGVLVEQRSLSDYLNWVNRTTAGQGTLPAITRLSFDASLKQLLAPLVRGDAVWLLPEQVIADPAQLYRALCRRDQTAVNCVPSLWRALLDLAEADPETALRGRVSTVLVGGEALTAELVDRTAAVLPGTVICNLYGPTEATANASAGLVVPGEAVTVGRPLDHARIYLLDQAMRPVPAGVTGRLYIGGTGVARGYPGRPDETARRFVPDPFASRPGDRLYDTGDLARYRPDGRIEFVGRADLQVKIRGFRVEPAGIEAVLRALPGVADAVVVPRDLPGGDKQLIAYVMPVAGESPALTALRAGLAEVLPDYMVPSDIVALPILPLTPTGKVDRRALAGREVDSGGTTALVTAPRSIVQEELIGIWGRLLGRTHIAPDDDFFQLGGHSLLVIQLVSRVRDAFGVDLAPQRLFAGPTLRAFTAEVERAMLDQTGLHIPAITPAAHGPLPLSFAQQRLWILDELEPGNPRYNVLAGRHLSGTVDIAAVRRAVAQVIARHDVLRTGFELVDGQPRQVVHDHIDVPVPTVDLRAVPVAGRSAQISRQATQLAAEPFDLSRPPLLRLALLELADGEAVLLMVVHHIVCDGWAKAVFFTEFAAGYSAGELPAPPVQYADYAVWQRDWLTGDVLDKQLDYWRHQLRGLPVLDLPTDRPRPRVPAYRGGGVTRVLTEEMAQALRRLSAEHGATLFMTTLTAFKVLLSKYTGQLDIVIGTPVANRNRTELENLIGFFVNTVVVRTDLTGDPGFTDLLGRVREVALGAYAHQDLPFEKLVEQLRPDRDPARTPLFQVMFVFVPSADAEIALGADARMRPVDLEPEHALFDLTLSVLDEGHSLSLFLNYDRDLFDAGTAERMLGHLAALLEGVVRTPHAPISRLPLLAAGEQDRLLDSWRPRDTADLPSECLHRLIENQAARTPDAIAMESADRSWTYRQLDERANQVASRLRDLGVGPESRVVVCVGRSPELVIALLAVLKSGGAYVPLDPAQPAARAKAILDEVAPAAVLLHPATADRFTAWPGPAVDLLCSDLVAEPVVDLGVDLTTANTAYVLYTSGSTGRPKGVVISHLAVVNELLRLQEEHRLDASDAVLLKTPATFDTSVWEFFWPLLSGARIVVTELSGHLDPRYLAGMIRRYRVTTVQFVPTMLRAFLDTDLTGLGSVRRVLCIGEALPHDLQERFVSVLPGVRLYNLYGPAEAAVHVTTWSCESDPAATSVPIGRPIANTACYVLDDELRPVPAGVTGQLYLSGVCLARGYLGAPHLTAERFRPDPFAGSGQRMYMTGDLVRSRVDGVLEFVGRADHQLKVRGQRVELGEVEFALLGDPQVREAVVVARQDASGDTILAAYLSSQDGANVVVAEVRQRLRNMLPEYMVPSVVVVLPDLPRSANGKLDRLALPEPHSGAAAPARFVVPRDRLEAELVAIWENVLQTTPVGVQDDFFELGGHSLAMIRLTSRVQETYGVWLGAMTVLDTPKLADFAARVRAELGSAPPAEPLKHATEPLLSYAQQRHWVINRLEPRSTAYHVIAAKRVLGVVDVAAAQRAVDAIVERHAVLRTGFPAVRGLPRPIVHDDVHVPLQLINVEHMARAEQDAAVRRHVLAAHKEPFDLGTPPLIRAVLIQLNEHESVLAVVMHHIVCDAWSMDVLFDEFAEFYRAYHAGSEPGLGELPAQYADFAAWQRTLLDGPELDRQREYWRTHLTGLAGLALPTDHPRPDVPAHQGRRVRASLSRDELAGLKELSLQSGTTLFMTTFAAFAATLGRFADRTDVAVGTPVTNRGRREFEDLIGCFVNTLVLRADLTGNPTFTQLLARVRATVMAAYDNQDLPFEQLLEQLRPARSRSTSPLFQVMFLFAPLGGGEIMLPGAVLRPMELDGASAVVDLRLLVLEEPDGLDLVLTYDTELFEEATALRVVQSVTAMLRAAVAEPHQPVMHLGATGEDEQQVHRLIEARAVAMPHAVAVQCADQVLTYRQLDEKADRLAANLRALGAGPGTVVAVLVERSVDLVAALLGVLKSGAAYLPLDPAYPSERTARIVTEAHPAVLLTDSPPARALVEHVGVTMYVHDVSPMPSARAQVSPDDLAYVIYTSGSTGTPKGVGVTHRNLAHSTRARRGFYRRPVDSFLLVSSVAFDSSVAGLFWTLCDGGRLVLPPPGAERDPRRLAALVAEYNVTHVLSVPSLYTAMCEAAEPGQLASLRTVIVAGEAMSADLRAPQGAALFNEYGVTECSVWSSVAAIEPGGPVTIGSPIADTTMYVLDNDMRPLPVGVGGELYIGGAGVSRGYVAAPGLTAARFVPDPFGQPGARLYRTGDLARLRADGQVELAGRADHQITLRGFRIEPAEVEAAILAQPGIVEAVVTKAGTMLTAYLVCRKGVPFDSAALREHLRQRLPEYMVPTSYVDLPDLPRTPNGKVDRAALPTPQGSHRSFEAPRDSLEKLLAGWWEQLFETTPVGVHDDFFALGGHSLLALQLLARIEDEFALELPLDVLFEAPTVARLATRIETAMTDAAG
jgi:amino acid adenylation domain-containing protein